MFHHHPIKILIFFYIFSDSWTTVLKCACFLLLKMGTFSRPIALGIEVVSSANASVARRESYNSNPAAQIFQTFDRFGHKIYWTCIELLTLCYTFDYTQLNFGTIRYQAFLEKNKNRVNALSLL